MRFDPPCPVYTSRDEYYSVASLAEIPKTSGLSSCEKINEGANGVIYRVNDEVAAKTF